MVGDVSTELGDYLADLPSDASTLETKLARQGELRALTRKYAADIDGVLAWAASRGNGWRSSMSPRRRSPAWSAGSTELRSRTRRRRKRTQQGAHQGGEGPRQGGDRRAVRAGDGRRRVHRRGVAADRRGRRFGAAHAAVGRDGARRLATASTRSSSASRAHRGTDVLPLSKSASGGELSRVMLALEVVLAASAEGTTMVFDEVDAGVGGRAAVQIGRRLARLARTHQVIVVTHLPQVAAYADIHLVVDSAGRNNASGVRRLDDDDRVAELARMLAGLGDSDSGRAHARGTARAPRRKTAKQVS